MDITLREVSVNYGKHEAMSSPVLTQDKAAALIRSVLPDNSREHFVAIFLDGSHSPIGFSIIATGGANYCQVGTREIYQRAVLLGATAIIVGHNHPSGSIQISEEDKKITDKISKAGKLLDIKVLDHVIVTNESYKSIKEFLFLGKE